MCTLATLFHSHNIQFKVAFYTCATTLIHGLTSLILAIETRDPDQVDTPKNTCKYPPRAKKCLHPGSNEGPSHIL